jgi:uncharacterized repeat protein (TIGR01451 family)
LEIVPAGYSGVASPVAVAAPSGQVVLQSRVPPLIARQTEVPVLAVGRERPSGLQGTEGMVTLDQFQGLAIAIGRINGASVVGVCKKIGEAPDRPLVLCKTADRKAVQVGDIVTFQLKYTNTGGQPIRDVVISDSLTARLEFAPGSAKTDRDAVFTTQVNEAGSQVLRWQFSGDLLPGQTGLISFQARVR